jgi:hypothetical protein
MLMNSLKRKNHFRSLIENCKIDFPLSSQSRELLTSLQCTLRAYIRAFSPQLSKQRTEISIFHKFYFIILSSDVDRMCGDMTMS